MRQNAGPILAVAGFKRLISVIKKSLCSAPLTLVKTADFCLKMMPPSLLCFYELLAPVQKR
jgi:hypothetical protein